jgi:hypothetical protein
MNTVPIEGSVAEKSSIHDGGDLVFDFRVIGTPRLLTGKEPQNVNANDNNAYEGLALAA